MNQQKRGKVAKVLEVRVKRERSLNLAKSGRVKKKHSVKSDVVAS